MERGKRTDTNREKKGRTKTKEKEQTEEKEKENRTLDPELLNPRNETPIMVST